MAQASAAPTRRLTRSAVATSSSARPLGTEGWNVQISLMTGMAAAKIMLDGGIGILRTMPQPDEQSIVWFRRRANALDHPWPDGKGYGDYLRTLDADDPKQLAILHAAASLFRGAGYTAFDGKHPSNTVQAAVAAGYARATAPLRRLVDRVTLVVCEALSNGAEVPGMGARRITDAAGDHDDVGQPGRSPRPRRH